jgi:hypothetical protein
VKGRNFRKFATGGNAQNRGLEFHAAQNAPETHLGISGNRSWRKVCQNHRPENGAASRKSPPGAAQRAKSRPAPPPGREAARPGATAGERNLPDFVPRHSAHATRWSRPRRAARLRRRELDIRERRRARDGRGNVESKTGFCLPAPVSTRRASVCRLRFATRASPRAAGSLNCAHQISASGALRLQTGAATRGLNQANPAARLPAPRPALSPSPPRAQFRAGVQVSIADFAAAPPVSVRFRQSADELNTTARLSPQFPCNNRRPLLN